jgi:hypothetical protein
MEFKKIDLKFNKTELVSFIGLIVLALITRLLPHPPNFAPITAIALFTGFNFANKKIVLLIPVVCMLITDFYLGFHSLMPVIYLSFLLISIMGMRVKSLSFTTILSASVLFFLLSNFGVWAMGGYPKSIEGLVLCYTMAIPFFVNSIIGDLFYIAVLQFSFEKLRKPVLVS